MGPYAADPPTTGGRGDHSSEGPEHRRDLASTRHPGPARSGAPVHARVPALLGAGVLALALLLTVVVAVAGDHVDFDVYVRAGERWLGGLDPYAVRPELPFTYPPVAVPLSALLSLAPAVGLAVLSLLTLLTAGGGAAAAAPATPTTRTTQTTRTTRGATVGVSLLAVAAAVVSEPVLRGLSLGQVNGLVVGLVLLDLLVVPPRWRGWLTGIAAGTKLTPLSSSSSPPSVGSGPPSRASSEGSWRRWPSACSPSPPVHGSTGVVSSRTPTGSAVSPSSTTRACAASPSGSRRSTRRCGGCSRARLVGVLGAVALHRRAGRPVIEGLVVAGLDRAARLAHLVVAPLAAAPGRGPALRTGAPPVGRRRAPCSSASRPRTGTCGPQTCRHRCPSSWTTR